MAVFSQVAIKMCLPGLLARLIDQDILQIG